MMLGHFCGTSLNCHGECVIITSSGSLAFASISSSCLFFLMSESNHWGEVVFRRPLGNSFMLFLTHLWHVDMGASHEARNSLHSVRAPPAGHANPRHALLLLLVLWDKSEQNQIKLLQQWSGHTCGYQRWQSSPASLKESFKIWEICSFAFLLRVRSENWYHSHVCRIEL